MAALLDNSGDVDYHGKIASIAHHLLDWQGPCVLISHVDPDGDAFGSTLALKRALDDLGKVTILPLDPPRYLAYQALPGELSAPLERLPEGALLLVLDVAEVERALGAPLEGAVFAINIDHHGTNSRFGDLALVEPTKAATAQIVKDLIDALGVAWTVPIATPCLTGILTDTGIFRYGNTNAEVLAATSELIEVGVHYADLVDRLQWHPSDYYTLLGRVMSTVEFPLSGLVSLAYLSEPMREGISPEALDGDDFVGLIRYAEGTKLAIFLKEREGATKVSIRSREGVSAQAICMKLGGGGHVAAAGAKIDAGLAPARDLVLEAARRELKRSGYSV